MKYISDVYALNIPCSLNTCGDWHYDVLDLLPDYKMKDSQDSIFGEWGIEEHDGKKVANHIRAILDMLSDNKTGYLKGFYDDFISTEEYDNILMEKVYELRNFSNWNNINDLMKKELRVKWIKYLEEKNGKR